MSSVQFERVRWKEIKNKIVQVGLQHCWKFYTTHRFFYGYIGGERGTQFINFSVAFSCAS